jgi:hypothetical protein
LLTPTATALLLRVSSCKRCAMSRCWQDQWSLTAWTPATDLHIDGVCPLSPTSLWTRRCLGMHASRSRTLVNI